MCSFLLGTHLGEFVFQGDPNNLHSYPQCMCYQSNPFPQPAWSLIGNKSAQFKILKFKKKKNQKQCNISPLTLSLSHTGASSPHNHHLVCLSSVCVVSIQIQANTYLYRFYFIWMKVKESRICHPKMCLFDIKIILNWRQLRRSKPRRSFLHFPP